MPVLERAVDRRDLLNGNWAGAGPVRPPGAVSRRRFDALCDGCGDCARACPAGAIDMAGPKTPNGDRSPRVIALDSPCVMCEGLVCASACPAGALAPATPATMRIAEVTFQAGDCWARQGMDPGCDHCFDRCPLKGEAITYTRGRGPDLHAEACTGCGTCVFYCPARPKALSVIGV